MFGQFGWGEMLLLIVVGLFVFGPERLPGIMRDAGKVIRQFRDTARSMRDDLQAELGPELADLDLKSLNPRTLVEKHLLGDDDDEGQPSKVVPPGRPTSPGPDLSKPDLSPLNQPPAASPLNQSPDLSKPDLSASNQVESNQVASNQFVSARPAATPYDDDAT